MSDIKEITDAVDEEYVQPDELTSLKAKASLMGISFHPSIGVDKLREKVLNALSDNPAPEDDEPVIEDEQEEEEDSAEPTPEELEEEAPVVSSVPKPAALKAAEVEVKEAPVSAPARVLTAQEKANEARNEARREATKQVRINVTCMNPLKSEWDGEIITVGNNLVGTVSKFVPFNTVDGWHVPNIIYLMLKDRQFQQFSAKKVRPGQPASRVTKLVREFAIEVLDPLTPQELAELKQRQLMAKGTQE